jgi:hypothetical protein
MNMSRFNEVSVDRRTKKRFPFQREMRYKILEHNLSAGVGTGQTVDISSGGVSFTADRSLPADAMVEISMSWPVTLDNECPLRLVVKGRVVRNEGNAVACTIDKFEFRTQARANNTVSILAGMCAARRIHPVGVTA